MKSRWNSIPRSRKILYFLVFLIAASTLLYFADLKSLYLSHVPIGGRWSSQSDGETYTITIMEESSGKIEGSFGFAFDLDDTSADEVDCGKIHGIRHGRFIALSFEWNGDGRNSEVLLQIASPGVMSGTIYDPAHDEFLGKTRVLSFAKSEE